MARCGPARTRYRPSHQGSESTGPVGRPLGRTRPTDPTHYCGKKEMTQLDTPADIHAAMQACGQRARAAAREIRRASDKSKATALRAMADLIEERGEQLK